MFNESPLVSICIPTYNRAGMVNRAIESALAQSYKHIEVLVVDNASDDDIESVIATYHDPRLKFFKNDRNIGLFGNFNRCVELAKGEYVHILHSDDSLDSDFTQTCVKFLNANPTVVMTFTSVQAISDVEHVSIGSLKQDHVFFAPEGFKEILKIRNLVSCPSVMIRKEIYKIVGLYSLEFPYSGDLYQWLKIAKRFDIAYVSGTTLFYQQGTHSESFQLLFKTPIGYIDTLKIFVRVVDELGDDLELYYPELNCAFRRHMRDCLFAGIARSETMIKYSSPMFIGFALSTWGLVVPTSISDKMKKFSEFLLIFLIGCAIVLPGGSYCVRKLFGFSPEKY
ncbi:MAG: glycosyltransferase [Methanoregula sp.]|nr:glycosyltransferase [Methanoregula sp.]